MEEIKGTYKHYKGGIYHVIGEGLHTETEEKLIFYKDDKGNLWARPTEMFTSTVEVNGKIVERFKRVNWIHELKVVDNHSLPLLVS